MTSGVVTSVTQPELGRNYYNALEKYLYTIGVPVATFSDTLPKNAIWLEGAQVSKVDYANLFAIYGTTYGKPTDTTKFTLPDLRNRVMWGTTSGSYGYINAGLPNITGTIWSSMTTYSGAFYATATRTWSYDGNSSYGSSLTFDASRSNSIYGSSTTVQPPSIKTRYYTYYK